MKHGARPMRATLAAVLAACLPGLSAAQSVFDGLEGLYGSTTDPAASCAANPHRLTLLASPPHVLLTWKEAVDDPEAGWSVSERFDILGSDGGAVILRHEGHALRGDGGTAFWVMRRTTNPEGYCWGRTDRPTVFCERPQERCDQSSPTS
jgi:hypothetical protein